MATAANRAWTSPTHVQWRHLAARLKAWSEGMTDRRDVTVGIAPGGSSSSPAGVFNHRTAAITLDADQTLPGRPDPSLIDLRDGRDRARHAVLAGVLAHELGHGSHSVPVAAPVNISQWVAVLEEPRMERRVIDGCAEARKWLRASAAHIIGTPEPIDAQTATRVLILFGGRVLAGVLDATELPDLDALTGQWLTADQIAVVGLETARAVDAADGDHKTIVSAATRIAALFADTGHDDEPASADDDCAAHRHGNGGLDPGGSLAEALGRIARDATRTLRLDAGVHDPSPAEVARRSAAVDRRDAIVGDYRDAHARRHVLDNRRATAAELAASLTLENRLRRAQARDVVSITTAASAPPGRLRTAELCRRAGQMQAGVAPTATPWSTVRRRTVDSPPLILGVALDISQSMTPYADPTALAQWMFTRAVRRIDGKVAVATWNSSVAFMPNTGSSSTVQVPRIEGGSYGLPAALRALTRELALDRTHGARIIAIVTDAYLPNPEDVVVEVGALVASGVRVLWLTAPDCHDSAMPAPAGTTATVLDEPSRIGEILAAATVEMLRQ